MPERLLSKHFSKLRKDLLNYSDHAGLAKHSDVIGQAREGFVRIFLEQNLPSLLNYRTGQIVDENDQLSPQVDIILESAFSPTIKLFGDIHIVLADYALSAIEVKSNLTTGNSPNGKSHLISALNSIRKIKKLKREHQISAPINGKLVTVKGTPCHIIAFQGPKYETLIKKLYDYGKYHNINCDSYWPETIVVLERKYTVMRNDGWLFGNAFKKPYKIIENPSCLLFHYFYLSQVIEAWNAKPHFTHPSKYLASKENKTG